MKKLLNDTLKSPSGKYSRKSLQWFVAMVLFIYIICHGQYTGSWAPDYIIYSLVGIILGLTGATIYDKIKNSKS